MLWLALPTFLVGLGCGDGGRGAGGGVAQVALARECSSPRDPELVLAILTQTVTDEQLEELHCVGSEECPCGTYCDDGFCTADCLATDDPDYGCSGSDECDLWGRCDTPGAPPAPERVVIAVTPLSADVAPADKDDPYVPVELVVTATALGEPAVPPRVRVRGNHTVRFTCPGGGETCDDASEEVVRELEVQCEEDKPFADECMLELTRWGPRGGGGFAAIQSIRARPRIGAEETAWQVLFDGDDIVGGQSVSLVLRPPTIQPFEGSYRGRMVISRRGPPAGAPEPPEVEPSVAAAPADLAVRVTAIAEDDHVLLVDPSRLVTPSGKVRLGPAGTSGRLAWLTGDGGALIGTMTSQVREHDPSTGHLRLRFALALPLRDGDAARSLDVLVDLDRTGAVTAPVCASGSKCTAGSTCDAVLQRCLPGPAFVTTTQPAGNGLASEALWSWTDAVVPHLAAWGISPSLPVGDDVIERLQCHDGPASINDAVLGKAIMTLTGDVRCAQASEPFPYGLRLLNGVDRNGGSSSSEDVGTLLGQCLADLAAVPPATPPAQFSPPVTSCISLMRVLPALGIAVGRPDFQTAGSRAARLVQHLIRGWITVSAFAAQQGLEAVDLGESDPSAPQTDLLALLDQLDGVWSVVTDGSVANALTSLPPRWLAEPDYRGSNRPRAYWAGHGSTDVASGRTLTPPSDAGWPGADLATIDPDELDLAGDLTVAMELDMDLADAFRGRRRLVQSPWFEATIVQAKRTHYELDYRRSATGIQASSGNTWSSCNLACVGDQLCWSWSFNQSAAAGQRCQLHHGASDHLYAPGWKSNVLATASRPYLDISDASYVAQTQYVSPSPLEVGTQPTWQACHDRCYLNDQCVAFTFKSAGTSCVLHSTTTLAAPTPCPDCSSAEMPRYTLEIGHGRRDWEKLRISIPLQRSALRTGPLKLVVVRSADGRFYRVYLAGAQIAQASFPAPAMPGRGSGASPFRVGRRDQINEASTLDDTLYDLGFENVGHVALWDSALDRGEITAMQTRPGNWAWRGPVPIPTGTAARNHDQRRPLAVTLVETLTRQVELLEAYLRSQQGPVYGECVAGQSTALRDQVQARTSQTLRGAVHVEDLAARMHDRARQLTCDRDDDCPADSQCGEHARIYLEAADAARTGLMQLITSPWETPTPNSGVGVPIVEFGDPNANGGLGANGSSVPGAVGTAVFSFDVATPGTYALWGMVQAGPYQRGFWIRVDGGAWQSWDIPGEAQWRWNRVAATFALTAGHHTITVGVRDDGTLLDRLVVTQEADRPPEALGGVCVADGEPLLAPITSPDDEAGESLFTGALAGLDAAMQRVASSAASTGECRNPLGIEEVDLPLYFMDVAGGPVQRHFGASIYLHGLAAGAVDTSRGALEDVRIAWNQKRLEKYQTETIGLDNQRRLEAIASQYSDGLEDLCGASSATAGGLLMEFDDGRDPATCFVKVEDPACLPNFGRPIAEADPTCYQGSAGQALIGMKQANFAVEGARLQWDAKQREYEARASMCAHLQGTAEILQAHADHMEALRHKKGLFDMVAGLAGLAAAVPSGYAAAALADDLFSGGWPSGEEAGGLGQLLGIASGATSLLGGLLGGSEIADEQARFQEQMALRDNETAILECFGAADRIRDEINLAASSISQAVSEFEQATITFASRRVRIQQLVDEGLADVARERDRTLALPYHHYWLDERIERYQRKQAWAQRLVYLLLRAVEHDAQQSLPFRADVLAARNPDQLEVVLEDIFQVLAEYEVGPRGGDPQARVLEVTLRQIMGLPSGDAESVGRHLLSPDSYVYTSSGELIGRGVRFQITPTSGFLAGNQIVDDCAEKFSTFTGSVQITGGSSLTRVPFVLMQANTFASQECVPASHAGEVSLLYASHRPSENLFDETGDGITDLGEVSRRTIATVSNFPNLRPQDLVGGDTQAVNTSFAGRGVYGDYVLVIRENVADQLDLASVTDVLIRIDYTGVENGLTSD
ncbi:MAG TPA: hypothetical protein VK698_00080 [Kofleriaceae bacterium]|nr:hypothetical protein [Kofleriaceae bacterium]